MRRSLHFPSSVCFSLLALVNSAVAAAAQQPIPLDTLRASAGSRAIAGAAAVTRSVDMLTRRDIEALPARSVSEVLARALGVDVQARSQAQADVSLRGSSFEQVLVLVDGVPVNDDQTGHFHLDTAVPLDAVERIEVLRGPASALYGSAAVGGVINIVTRRGTPELAARAQGGSHEALIGALEAASAPRNGFAARVSAEHDRSDGHRPGTDHRITQARVALDAPLARGALRADVGYAARDFGANRFYAPYDSYEETRAATAALAWRRAFGAVSLEPRVSFRQHEDDFILVRDNPALYRNIHKNQQLAGELVAHTRLAALRIALGAEAVRSEIESRRLGDRSEDRVALFGEVGAGDAARGMLTAGVRVDRHSAFGTFLSPSLAASYAVSPRVRLRGSAGTGFRAPSWTDRYYEDPSNVGDPNLDAERFWTAELGSAIVAHDRVSIDIAAFVRQGDDLIDWARPTGAAPNVQHRARNVESATFRGIEAITRLELSRLELTGRASLLDFDSEDEDAYVSRYVLRPLTRALSVEAALPLIANTKITLRGAAYRRAGGAADERWSLVDARLTGSMGAVQLFADATNLLDEEYRDLTAQIAPGRAFAVGIRVRR